ncbi:MAG: alpha-ketoglutarate-dependent dioxygenase AlkB [Woeseiaceae bacterium]
MDDLFQSLRPAHEEVLEGITLLSGFADTTALLADLPAITDVAPFRQMVTPGGKPISVAVTNCGSLGWTSGRSGYRYRSTDPNTNQPWAPMPVRWTETAKAAAKLAGYDDYSPNACLINRYLPGNRMTAHQDKNERNFAHPVVTVSTGLPAEFLIWGAERAGSPISVPVYDGDVMIMGGAARLHYHGVKTLKPDPAGKRANRISLTFRNA